jgi:hypothetical protein
MSETIDMSNNVLSDNDTTNTITENKPLQSANEEQSPIVDEEETTYNLFSMDSTTMLMIFAGIVIVLYLLLGRLFGDSSNESPVNGFIGKMVDIVLFGLLIFWGIFYYNSKSGNILNEEDFSNFYNWAVEYLDDVNSVFSSGFILLGLYLVVYLFGIPMTKENKPISIAILETVLIASFVLIIFISFFKHILDISIMDVIDSIKRAILGEAPEEVVVTTDISGSVPPEPQDEVFNISTNSFTYEDAQAVCSIYDAELATYDQIEEAYNNGAEWCSYGWSADQMAFFPTQKKTWDKLQKSEKHKNNCGRPGVNGGHIANPYIKFGVNCYGKKPKPSDHDLKRMKANEVPELPPSKEEKEKQDKIQKWKDNADEMLRVNAYNKKRWSKY